MPARYRHLEYQLFIMFTFSVFKPATVRDRHGRLSVTEESEMRAEFGGDFDHYAALTPRFLPRFIRPAPAQ